MFVDGFNLLDHDKVHSTRTSGVDGNEDAKATGFQNFQLVSTGAPHLIEMEGVENRRFPMEAGNCLGRRGGGRSNRPAPTNRIKRIWAFPGRPKISLERRWEHRDV